MNQTNLTIDPSKKKFYQNELETHMKKYRDKKSELQWVDDEFEESLIVQEMELYAKKIRHLKQVLKRIEEQQKS